MSICEWCAVYQEISIRGELAQSSCLLKQLRKVHLYPLTLLKVREFSQSHHFVGLFIYSGSLAIFNVAASAVRMRSES